jgi:hypothetical protein
MEHQQLFGCVHRWLEEEKVLAYELVEQRQRAARGHYKSLGRNMVAQLDNNQAKCLVQLERGAPV